MVRIRSLALQLRHSMRDRLVRRRPQSLTAKAWRAVRLRRIRLDRLLMGTGPDKWLRLAEGPNVRFLEQYLEIGDHILTPSVLRSTTLHRYAFAELERDGRYYEATNEQELLRVMRDFLNHFDGAPMPSRPPGWWHDHSPSGSHPTARAIRYSPFYQIIDGHHRLAIAYVQGRRDYRIGVDHSPTTTPAQDRLLVVRAARGAPRLSQPVDWPEVAGWPVTRQCTDRLVVMRDFLGQHSPIPARSTYIDLACEYGWFVNEFAKLGYHSSGADVDGAALEVGKAAYGLNDDRLRRCDALGFLETNATQYDIVSYFDSPHHFPSNEEGSKPDNLLRLLDRMTGKVLFIDTEWTRQRSPASRANRICSRSSGYC